MEFKLGGIDFTGEDLNAPLQVRDFQAGGADVRNNDSERSQRDGLVPGVDLLGGRLWTWELQAKGAGLADVLAANATLEAAWRVSTRLQPGIMVPLSYQTNNRWRRVYGRPGRYTGPVPDPVADIGVGKIVCDFRVLDPFYYDDVETSVVLTMIPATNGGMMTPFVTPLSTVRSSTPRAGLLTNAGDSATPLKVKFHGPVVNPWVRSSDGSMEIGLNATLAYDKSITVSPRDGTVTWQDGTPANGLLTRKTRMQSTLLQSGSTSFSFGGTDQTGTATATLSWRNAYASI
jgi:hypothetical protein